MENPYLSNSVLFLYGAIAAILLQLFVMLSPAVRAQESVETDEVTGQVVQVQDARVFIETNEGVREVQVPTSVNMERNGKDIRPSELESNDQVTVTYGPGGDILSVQTIPAYQVSITRNAIMIGAVLGLLALTALVIIRRHQPNGFQPLTTSPAV